MKYLTGDMATLSDARAALAKIAGLPRRGTVVGGPDNLPQTYSPGAAGWTDQLVPDVIDVGDGTCLLAIHADAERYAGAKVDIGAKAAITIATAVDEAVLSKAAQDKVDASASAADTVKTADAAAVKS